MDGGKSWAPYSVGASISPENGPVFFFDRQTVLGFTQHGLERTTDGGRTWQPVTVPLPEKAEGISRPALAVTAPQAAGRLPEAWLARPRP
jgi:photosystem II stability/assembly factor-like uncharacterized protein